MDQIGKYRVVRLIGAGGMGRVYEAIDPLIGRRVAIKTLSLDILNDIEARGRFFREAQAAGQLSHPHLITIYDTGEAEGHPYLVMEYLEGEDLSRVILGRQLSLSAKLQLMVQMCHGLAYAHGHGVVHRDIKPANVFLTAQGIKILDFGLARGGMSEVTQTGRVLGTPNYMAPEQIRGEGADHRADIFALGVVFYELLSGRKAFEGDSVAATIYKVLEFQPEPIHHWDSTLPTGLSDVVQRALAKDRNARYQRIEELLGDITRIQAQIDGVASDPRRPTTRMLATGSIGMQSAQHRSRQFLWAAAAVVVVAAGLALAMFSRRGPSRPETVQQQATSATSATPSLPPAPISAQTPQPAAQPSPQPAPAAEPARPAPAVSKPAAQAETTPRRSTTGAAAAPERTNAAAPRTEPAPSPPAVAVPPRREPEPPATPPELRAPVLTAPEATHATPPPPVSPPAAPPAAPPPAPSPAPAPAPAASNAPPTAEAATAAVQETLARYKAALEARDMTALKQVWPGLSGRQEVATRSEFDNSRSIAMELRNVAVQLGNGSATITCRRSYMVTTLDNRMLQSTTRMIVTMQRHNNSWVIDAIRHEADR